MGRKKKGGYGVVYQDVTRSENISLAAKGLYAYLASFCGQEDECYPGVEMIMKENGIGKDTFYKHINSLVAAGVVKKEQVKGEGGKFGRTVYKLSHEITISEKTEVGKTGFPYPQKQYTVSPDTAVRETNNNNIKTITDSNNNNINNTHSAADELFDELWKLYPNKKGKGQVSEKVKKRLLEIGRDEMIRAIDRYKAELKKDDWRQQQYGSTFFNSGFMDYLDANYVPGQKTKAKNDFLNHEQSGTDYAALEKMLG